MRCFCFLFLVYGISNKHYNSNDKGVDFNKKYFSRQVKPMSNFAKDFNRNYSHFTGIQKVFVFFYFPGVYACLIYRLLNHLYKKDKLPYKVLYRLLFFLLYVPFKFITGVEIHPEAEIEGGLSIPHCTSIVIAKNAKIGENFTIHQCCTVGMSYKDLQSPVIGDNVFLSCNASIIGDIMIGNNVLVLPNSSVAKSVGNSVIVGGVPAKVIKENPYDFYQH
jgi:serine O-acetyltransferase